VKIFFGTGNPNKVQEVSAILKRYGIIVKQFPIERVEIQADELEPVARFSLEMVKNEIPGPCFVEDAGLFINALNGFPGPYSSYAFKKIGNRGILNLMKEVTDRTACFKSAIAFLKPGENMQIVVGETFGKIALEIRGSGWGFDPIFVPEESGQKTYGEMTPSEKNEVSHRQKALKKLVNLLDVETNR